MSNDELIVKITGKIIQAQSEIADLEEAIKNYKAKLSEMVPATGTVEVGDFWVQTYTNKRWDDATAKKNLSPELYALTLDKPKSSATKAKANLTEEQLELGKKVFDQILKVGLRED